MEDNMSNLTTSAASGEADIASVCSDIQNYPFLHEQYFGEMPKDNSNIEDIQPSPAKKRRNLPGNPDPSAEVIALSPNSLLATNRFLCEICQKGFQRDQNLQLHRRGHNLPWKLKQRTSKDIPKKVYICPEISCIHHDPLRALGDLTGIKKHFSRKHGEKKWKCDKCSKKYAVKSDWKAHCKTCGTREYRCDCGTLFTRRDTFITHRAFCDALAEASARTSSTLVPSNLPFSSPPRVPPLPLASHHHHQQTVVSPLAPRQQLPPWLSVDLANPTSIFSSPSDLHDLMNTQNKLKVPHQSHYSNTSHRCYETVTSAHISATALLQKAAGMGATVENSRTNFAPNMFFLESKDLILERSPRVIMGPNSLLIQDMPNSLSSSSPFVFGSSFEDCASNTFCGLLSSGKNEGFSFHEAGMTRDFLGLRPITSNEFLNFGDQVNGHDLNQYRAQNHDKNR